MIEVKIRFKSKTEMTITHVKWVTVMNDKLLIKNIEGDFGWPLKRINWWQRSY